MELERCATSLTEEICIRFHEWRAQAFRALNLTTAPTQMPDDWLKEMDNMMIVGAVLLDFSAAFDIK